MGESELASQGQNALIGTIDDGDELVRNLSIRLVTLQRLCVFGLLVGLDTFVRLVLSWNGVSLRDGLLLLEVGHGGGMWPRRLC